MATTLGLSQSAFSVNLPLSAYFTVLCAGVPAVLKVCSLSPASTGKLVGEEGKDKNLDFNKPSR